YCRGYAAHGHCLRSLLIQQVAGGNGDSRCRSVGNHIYSVYQSSLRRIHLSTPWLPRGRIRFSHWLSRGELGENIWHFRWGSVVLGLTCYPDLRILRLNVYPRS